MSTPLVDDVTYDSDFFKKHENVFRESASRVLPLIIDWLAPKSLVDVGCGEGAWLIEASLLGIEDLTGYDGEWVDPGKMIARGIKFQSIDLAETIPVTRRFDVALCLEVAEHLPASRAESLVEDLCRLSDVIVFSGAIPHQGGTGHINERYPSYWAGLFSRAGHECFDILRPRVWSNEGVGWWYRQNTVLYATGNAADRLRRIPSGGTGAMLDLVHPFNHESKMACYTRDLEQMRKAIQKPTFRQLGGYAYRWARTVLRRGSRK